MFVRIVFIFLFTTIGIVDFASSISVAGPPKNFTISAENHEPTSSTFKPSDDITSAKSNKPSTIATTFSPEDKHTTHNDSTLEPVHINHNRTDDTITVATTSKPPSKTTTQPLAVVHVDTTTTSEHWDHSTTTDPFSSSTTIIYSTTRGTMNVPSEEKDEPTKTTVAGIVALVCVSIASFALVALIAWRYTYRRRHGNREILINEEDVDFNDEDLRHFELKLLNSEGKAIPA